MKYEIKADNFISAIEQIIAIHLRDNEDSISRWEMNGARWKLVLTLKKPKKG